jgi:hypothetical protein
MQKQSEKKGWDFYQYYESSGSCCLNADRTGPLAENLRPPHEYEIGFIIIVNRDSLHAWQEWNKNFDENMMVEIEKMKTSNDFSSVKAIQESKKTGMERYRNVSMIRLKIDINPEDAIASSITEDIHRTAQLNVPHSVLAYQFHNDKLDEKAIYDLNQFTRCSDLAFVLFGNWNINPDSYQYYRPGYSADKKNIDLVTPKKIASTKIRTIVMHVEASPKYIGQFLQSLNTDALNSIIDQ